MSEFNDGGPAFPLQNWDAIIHAPRNETGMTLRDYFAAAVSVYEIYDLIPSSIGKCAAFIGVSIEEYKAPTHYKHVLAKARYMWADAMLA